MTGRQVRQTAGWAGKYSDASGGKRAEPRRGGEGVPHLCFSLPLLALFVTSGLCHAISSLARPIHTRPRSSAVTPLTPHRQAPSVMGCY